MAETSTSLKDYVKPSPRVSPPATGPSNPTETDERGRPISRGDLSGTSLPKANVTMGTPEGLRARPGIYGAADDPYTYRLNDDGSVTIMEGPSGQGSRLDDGIAYKAILGQIRSGKLNYAGGSVEAGGDEMEAVEMPGHIVPTPARGNRLVPTPSPLLAARERNANPDDKLRQVVEDEMKR